MYVNYVLYNNRHIIFVNQTHPQLRGIMLLAKKKRLHARIHQCQKGKKPPELGKKLSKHHGVQIENIVLPSTLIPIINPLFCTSTLLFP